MTATVFMDTETTGLALTDDIWEFGPDEPTPSDLQVAPSLGATGTAGVRLMREGIERSRADAAAPSPPVDRETLLLVSRAAGQP